MSAIQNKRCVRQETNFEDTKTKRLQTEECLRKALFRSDLNQQFPPFTDGKAPYNLFCFHLNHMYKIPNPKSKYTFVNILVMHAERRQLANFTSTSNVT